MVNQLWARTMRSWRVLLPTAVVLVGVTGVAIAGPMTKGAPKGVTVYTNYGNGALPKHGSGYLPQNIWPPPGVLVAAVSVPAGHFVANAKIYILNTEDDESPTVRCSLRGAKGQTVDKREAYLKEFLEDEVVVLQGTSSSKSKQGFSLWCAYRDGTRVHASGQVLTAVRVSKVDEQ